MRQVRGFRSSVRREMPGSAVVLGAFGVMKVGVLSLHASKRKGKAQVADAQYWGDYSPQQPSPAS